METREHEKPRRGPSRSTWVLLGFLAIAGYFLLTEHRAHFVHYLPFVLLLACPLLHLFHGHGGVGDGHSGHDPGQRGGDGPPDPGAPHRHAGDSR